MGTPMDRYELPAEAAVEAEFMLLPAMLPALLPLPPPTMISSGSRRRARRMLATHSASQSCRMSAKSQGSISGTGSRGMLPGGKSSASSSALGDEARSSVRTCEAEGGGDTEEEEIIELLPRPPLLPAEPLPLPAVLGAVGSGSHACDMEHSSSRDMPRCAATERTAEGGKWHRCSLVWEISISMRRRNKGEEKGKGSAQETSLETQKKKEEEKKKGKIK